MACKRSPDRFGPAPEHIPAARRKDQRTRRAGCALLQRRVGGSRIHCMNPNRGCIETEGRVGQNPETRRLRPVRRPKRRSCAVGVKGERRAFARFAGRAPVSNGTHWQGVQRGASPPGKRPEKKFGKGLDICREGCYNTGTCLLWGRCFLLYIQKIPLLLCVPNPHLLY